MDPFSVLYLVFFIVCNSHGSPRAVIEHPNAPSPFLAILSHYNKDIGDFNDKALNGNLIFHGLDPEGCAEWQSVPKQKTNQLSIGIVDRGTCTFLEKTKYAQSSGLDALLIVSSDESMTSMGADEKKLEQFKVETNNNIILTMMVPQSFKTFMSSSGNKNTSITINKYNPKIWDFAMLIMIGLSTVLVGIGAYYSADMERAKMYNSNNNNRNGIRRRAPIQEIDNKMAWSFILIASTGLLTLYFFASKIFIVIVIIFCIGATNGLSTIFAHFIDYIAPNLQKKEYYLEKIDLQFTLSDFLGFIPAAMLSITWYISRRSDFAWILQNVMCVGLLLVLQRTIRLTNLKIASILLGTAFFYDIFWVFLSPYFFSSSVMVSVATYQHGGDSRDTLPVVLKFPRLNDIFHSPMILGLGDIALPGLLVSYLLRYDYLSKVGIDLKNGYFLPALIGYGIGMLLTDINLILMQSGQPALLFLVPCTLGTTAVIAYKRGHLKALWNGVASQYKITKSNEFLLKS